MDRTMDEYVEKKGGKYAVEEEAEEPTPVAPPGRSDPRPTVAVIGAGIAGLTAAHELAERGFDVTVIEPSPEERPELGFEVKLGGMAASQFAKCRLPLDDKSQDADLIIRPFPGDPENSERLEMECEGKTEHECEPDDPALRLPGEHGFRFFPAYYLHIWDLMQQIPVYEYDDGKWRPTSRTVYDNVNRVITQATTTDSDEPTMIFPREAPRSLAEFFGVIHQLRALGYSPSDLQSFTGRLMRFLATSPGRRAEELEAISAYDFFVDRDEQGRARIQYTKQFDDMLKQMPKVLAAFDVEWGDARTNIDTLLQLQLRLARRDNKADGVLNGPTSEAWFDHWYRHLERLCVTFVQARVRRLSPIEAESSPRGHPEHDGVKIDFEGKAPDGLPDPFDYIVVATDAPQAELLTQELRDAGIGGTVEELEGWATSKPPATEPPGKGAKKRGRYPQGERNPYKLDEIGVRDWDRFQNIAGIQYYFDTEFQLVRGHVYYSDAPWALSSINQTVMWRDPPMLHRNRFVSILSVDIGAWNTPGSGNGKKARDCTVDEIAEEVWYQITKSLDNNRSRTPLELFPQPLYYTIDRNLTVDEHGYLEQNRAPYLVPIKDDWKNRPGLYPWNPQGTSWTTLPADLERAHRARHGAWSARHGGYEVHLNTLVFAGTWTKTFTRMTSMEAACESGRHAVNAVLDHYIYAESGMTDQRDDVALLWNWPLGFLDQEGSSPIRQPTPVGDYAFIFDIENWEPADFRPTRILDQDLLRRGKPHPWESIGIDAFNRLPGGGDLYSDPYAPGALESLLESVRRWRDMFDNLYGDDGQEERKWGPFYQEPPRSGPSRDMIARPPTE